MGNMKFYLQAAFSSALFAGNVFIWLVGLANIVDWLLS